MTSENEVLQTKGKEFVWKAYQDFLVILFDLRHPLLYELCGLREGNSIHHPVHQQRYVMNTIGAQVGFEDGIELDPHAQCIYPQLIDKGLSDAILIFCKYFSPSKFVDFLIKRVNLMVFRVRAESM